MYVESAYPPKKAIVYPMIQQLCPHLDEGFEDDFRLLCTLFHECFSISIFFFVNKWIDYYKEFYKWNIFIIDLPIIDSN